MYLGLGPVDAGSAGWKAVGEPLVQPRARRPHVRLHEKHHQASPSATKASSKRHRASSSAPESEAPPPARCARPRRWRRGARRTRFRRGGLPLGHRRAAGWAGLAPWRRT